jgi:hypothetical protein
MYFTQIVNGGANRLAFNRNYSSGMTAHVRTENLASQTMIIGDTVSANVFPILSEGSGSVDTMAIGHTTNFTKGAAGYIMKDGLDVGIIGTPGNPGAGVARFFARNNAGKVQLCVLFPSGAVVTLATEA